MIFSLPKSPRTQYRFALNWFELLGLWRKFGSFCPVEGFFKLHSIATEREKDNKWVKKDNFLANSNSLN
jgi:hypothetical protein